MFMGIVLLAVGIFGLKYGIAAIIAAIGMIAVSLGIKGIRS